MTSRIAVTGAARSGLAGREDLVREGDQVGDGGVPRPLAPGEDDGDGLVIAYGTPPEHVFTAALDVLRRALPAG
ncbi:hypothetical protein ACFWAT_08415 [Streptomyces syringium]|uniref:hypothetical protein n=1 Tax=Streptomyces syringium TaxID=76729 RepID=UPI00364F8485